MVWFDHKFRNFTGSDYMGYAGAEKLPNGDDPQIYSVDTPDDIGVDILLSGDGEGNTIISLETEIGSYYISLPGINRCHTAIADSMIQYFSDYEVTSEAIESIVSDYEMNKF